MAPQLRVLALALALALPAAGLRRARPLARRGAPPLARRGASKEPYWAFKGGNLNRTGYSPYVGAFDLSKPAWTFQEPNRAVKGLTTPRMKVFHSTPILDGDRNVYIQSTTGWVYSLTPEGEVRWSYAMSDANPGNLALLDGALYSISQDGVAHAIDAATGKTLWRRKVAKGAPDDTHSLVAVGDTVLTACNPHVLANRRGSLGGEAICALRTSDGSVKWNYVFLLTGGQLGYNNIPAVVDGTVVFNDWKGGVYRISLQDGKELWRWPAVSSTQVSTGGAAVGPNEKIYEGFNTAKGRGMLRVHDLHTGVPLWNRSFHEEVNAGPAVGRVSQGGPLAVVVAVGNNVACTPISKEQQLRVKLGRETLPVLHAEVKALDAETGREIWTFAAPTYSGPCAGTDWMDICCPDVWGTPSIGADGTVYVNWSGGVSFSLRDANGDGRVDPTDPQEVSKFHHGGGSNGNTAIAPGFAVVPSCWKVMGFKA